MFLVFHLQSQSFQVSLDLKDGRRKTLAGPAINARVSIVEHKLKMLTKISKCTPPREIEHRKWLRFHLSLRKRKRLQKRLAHSMKAPRHAI